MYDSLDSIILGRRSIRRYHDLPVAREVLETILNAASWAPSAHNRQPWRFAVITSPQERRELALAMGARLRADLHADNVPSELIEKDANRSYARLTAAPVIVIVCLTMLDMDRYPDIKRSEAEHLMAVQSTAMAVQNLLLESHARGLGACWMCAPLFCPDVVSSQLGLPADWEPQALLTLGYPAETRQSSRHPLQDRVIWR
ncbi:MAG TPA: nitroreductase family protein [Aggregatilineales bacterium]|nr:nitroreductase family protein [Aggregatilineales bacterium]